MTNDPLRIRSTMDINGISEKENQGSRFIIGSLIGYLWTIDRVRFLIPCRDSEYMYTDIGQEINQRTYI